MVLGFGSGLAYASPYEKQCGKDTSPAVVTVFVDRPNAAGDILSRLLSPGGRKIAGSGFIVTPEGLVITSAHVVAGGVNPSMRFCDGSDSPARIVVVDDRSDVAVLQILGPPASFPTLSFSTTPLQVGDVVEALGSPFGGEQQARRGTVKTTPLTNPGIADFPPLVETTTPLTPGYSGGPLLDQQNDVVGINAAIYSHKGQFQGLSFAVPVVTAKRILLRAKALLAPADKGAEPPPQPVLLVGQQPLSGASVVDLTAASAHEYGVDSAGTGVVMVDPGHGYADEAGFEIGDVIVSINGRPATSTATAIELLGQTQNWTIEILRGDRRLTQTFEM
jgi:serine protease Do